MNGSVTGSSEGISVWGQEVLAAIDLQLHYWNQGRNGGNNTILDEMQNMIKGLLRKLIVLFQNFEFDELFPAVISHQDPRPLDHTLL